MALPQFPLQLIFRVILIHHGPHLTSQVLAQMLEVQEVAVATPVTRAFFEEAAPRFVEIRHRRILYVDRLARVETAVETFEGSFRIRLAVILDVDVSDHVVTYVIADMKFSELSEFRELDENFFIKVLKVTNRFNQ